MVELNLVGNFQGPFGSNWTKRLEAGRKGTFSPDSFDFDLVVRQGRGQHQFDCGRARQPVLALLHQIVLQTPGSVSRLNIVSHGDPDSVALEGSFRDGVPYWVRSDDPKTAQALSTEVLDQIIEADSTSPGDTDRAKLLPFSLAEVRKRFAPHASIYVLACHSGAGKGGYAVGKGGVLGALATIFGARVVGYPEAICYCFDDPPPKKPKWILRLGTCDSEVSADDYHVFTRKASEHAVVVPKPSD